ncbi:DUF982 domain-containing protein, partial [Rhizobium johnstonii]|uniref:DUF982 domain-containing protein n=1 Tax=Rhizobium johnstonii TaxID=3019933 RepID=UPI003F9DD60F
MRLGGIQCTLTSLLARKLNDWPCDDGEEYVAAVKACVEALSGKIAQEQFREALLRAADEAGIAALSLVR